MGKPPHKLEQQNPTRDFVLPGLRVASNSQICEQTNKFLPSKPVEIQSGGSRMFPPDSYFENDTRKTIIRCGYVLIFNVRRDHDFVDPPM